jgi:thiamine biosynthesis protein ThiS
MYVTVNGERRTLEREVTLREVLETFGIASERVAIELNRSVVRRRDWESTLVREADRIEIVHFVGGG